MGTFFVTQYIERSLLSQSKEQQSRSPLIQLKERSLLFQLNDQQPTQSLRQADVRVLLWVALFPTIFAPTNPLQLCTPMPSRHEWDRKENPFCNCMLINVRQLVDIYSYIIGWTVNVVSGNCLYLIGTMSTQRCISKLYKSWGGSSYRFIPYNWGDPSWVKSTSSDIAMTCRNHQPLKILFQSTPNEILTAHTERLAGMWLITTCTVRTELSLWPSVVFAADEWTNLMHGHS